ncbi:hypothetical protein [Nonomuraea sediminis]|uniref:hypothetical protein n=1 Tax=Nonomuraea sediminis TaxID=2835864 RepID=UPI001BDC101B|nr:hypothetical protein [Nonomuraea sediminis]
MAITRETLTEFTDAPCDNTAMAEDDSVILEEEPSDQAHLASDGEVPHLPPLRGFRQQVVALLAAR